MPDFQRDMLHPQPGSMRPSAPYVGLRPYEREERDIFIGRNRDAQYLTDKIFSANLTLLYSKSGLGKSSILRALVIPALEQEEARVVYFDNWSGEDPALALKSELTQLATDLGIPDAGAGSPSLAELMLLISSFDRRTLVLILDQFEEFLVHHQGIEPLGAELAELVRAKDLDVRLIISLRQEFLAALEPLRQKILNLFHSTYLLETLGDEAVRKAIEEPARKFGKNFEPGLLTQLLDDLKQPASRQAPLPSTKNGAQIELPVLQLVCDELWKVALKQKVSTITSELYEQLGGVRKILKDYVQRVMPRGLRDGYFTARLLVPLAPPSGLKISYSVDDLASITGLDRACIRSELKRLGRMRILRTRKFQKSERFELQHDSFIKIVAPWRDRILERVRRLRRGAWGLVALCMFVLVGFGWFQVQGKRQLELYNNTEGPLEELISMPAEQRKRFVTSRLDNAASYMLWRRQGSERLIGLKQLLLKYHDLQPRLYGLDITAMGATDYPRGDWPVSFHYSFQRDLKWDSFSATWRGLAKFITEQWNIPVPKRLRLKEEHIFPKRLMQFKGPDATKVDLDIEPHEAEAFINTDGLVPAAREFFERFETNWELIEDVQKGGQYYIVPRWSLAVWRASGIEATDGSGLPAFLLALKLQEQPENLLTSQAVELLLERVERLYPHTVSEARAARGPRLRQDLIEWVKLGRAFTHLPVLLDALARYPAAPPAETAAAVAQDLEQTVSASLPRRFTGPWPPPEAAAASANPDPSATLPNVQPTAQEKEGDKIHPAYREVEHWLPPVEHVVRVVVGHNLEQLWFPTGDLPADLQERIEALRDDFFRRFGYDLPGVRFKGSGWDPDLDPDAFRIELLNETAADTQSITIDRRAQNGLDQLIQTLQARTQSNRVYLLTCERVERLINSLEPALRDWLYERFSLTDLKLLARAVIAPGPLELVLAQTGADDIIPAPAREGTLRHFGWLMGSLVFWNQINDSRNVQKLAEALRSTQRARFQPPAGLAKSGPLAKAIADGIRKLADQRLKQAQNAFKRASAMDSESAVSSFLAAYAAQLPSRISAQIDRECKDPTGAWLTRQQRLNIEEQLARTDPASAPEIHRQNTLCLCSGYPGCFIRRRREIVLALLTKYGSPDQWPAAQASWLAIQVLQDIDPIRYDPSLLQSAAAFLKSAIPRLDQQQSDNAFFDLSDVCHKGGARNWCWDLMVEIAEQHPVGHIPLEFAYQLSSREHAQDLHQALRMLSFAKKNLYNKPGLTEKYRKSMLGIIKFTRAQTLKGLGELGHKSYLPEAEQLFTELLSSPQVGPDAYLNLIDLLLAQARYPEADQHIQAAISAWPDKVAFHQEKFWVELLQGDIEAAAATAGEGVDQASQKEEELFLAALGQILTGRGQWELAGRKFLASKHEYVDYLTMILYARLAGPAKEEARQLLEQRWAKIQPNTWSQRRRGGDVSVWREMLIGYYMGTVSSEEIFGVLEDETRYQRSELRYLPLSRSSMLCEAYFYDAMLAQARGDIGKMRKQLEHVLDTGKSNYHEFKMAKYLLDGEQGGEPRMQAGRRD